MLIATAASFTYVHFNMSQLRMEVGQTWASYLLSSGNLPLPLAITLIRPHSCPLTGIALCSLAVRTSCVDYQTYYHMSRLHSARFMGCTSCVEYHTYHHTWAASRERMILHMSITCQIQLPCTPLILHMLCVLHWSAIVSACVLTVDKTSKNVPDPREGGWVGKFEAKTWNTGP